MCHEKTKTKKTCKSFDWQNNCYQMADTWQKSSLHFLFTDTLHILICLTPQSALMNTHHTHSKRNWAEETLTINVVGMVAQDVSVELGCLVILVKRLVQACQVVGGRHGDGAVVGFIMLGICLWSLQWSFIVFLCEHLRHFFQCQQHTDFSLTSLSSHSPWYHSFLFHLFHSFSCPPNPPPPPMFLNRILFLMNVLCMASIKLLSLFYISDHKHSKKMLLFFKATE